MLCVPENLLSDLLRRVHADAEDVVMRRPSAGRTGSDPSVGGQWSDVRTADFLAEIRALAGGLRAHGVTAGDRILVLAHTRYEWTLVDYAIWYVGGVSVPVFPATDPETLRSILTDARPRLALADTADHQAAIRACAPDLPLLPIDELGLAALADSPALFPPDSEPDDPATIVYTAGTTGQPRGCVLSHRSLLAAASSLSEALPELFSPGGRTLVVLPLPHVLARQLQVACVRAGVVFGHGRGVSNFTEDAAAVRPTFLVGVPRLFERIYTRASQQAAADGKARTFNRATETAIAISKARADGRRSLGLRARHALMERQVLGLLRESLGGACRYAICGGAPLGHRLGHFFRGAGVPILEGYVLTETAGLATVTRPRHQVIGSVGRPVPGVQTSVDDDGELLVRSPQLFDGYWGDPTATGNVLIDGWLHTGDLVEEASDNLTVIGRKRELIVTAGGKEIIPTAIEDRISGHDLIDRVIVVGDGQPYLAALVTLDATGFAAWKDRTGKKGSIKDLADDPDLRGAVKVAIEQANRKVSPSEAVRKFVVLPQPWTVAGGHLTPSQKLRRDVVLRQNRSEIEHLFAF